jgi:tetratricopeptide (TPR) repeat protein
MNKISFKTSSIPLALFFFCVISFGVLIPWLGFYWDDWPAIWYLHVFGPSGFGDVFAVDRPLLGWLFTITTPWLGTSAAAWQVFGIITRWLSVLAFWWFLRALWPSNPSQTAWAALLFAVYPGFKQQFISVTYSHTWILATTFLLSLGIMAWSFRKKELFWLLMAGSWVLSAYTLYSVEYFFGLELLRPVFLWVMISETMDSFAQRLKRTLLLWIPYTLVIISFLFWRLIYYPTVRGSVQLFDKLSAEPAGTLWELVETAIQDAINAGFVAWAQILDLFRMTSYGSGPTLLYLAGVIIATTAAIFYLSRLELSGAEDSEAKGKRRWAIQALLIGAAALLLAGIPFWVTNLPIGLEFPWDRFTLAMMFGSSLALTALVDLILRTPLQKAVILGTLIGFSSGLHLQYSNLYRREWNTQSEFFWQLSWRAPAIEPGTVLLTAELPFIYFSDNSLTAPLNWTYAPDLSSQEMPYLLYAAEARHEESLESFKPGIAISQPYRATEFNGSTSQALVLYFTPPGCLKLVDPATDKKTPQKPKFISDMMPLSRPELIHVETKRPARPPETIFGEEPDNLWCYYFEQAELARQSGDWQQVAALADRAFQLDQRVYEVNAPEFITYIEGYARTDRWQDAVKLTNDALQLSERMDRLLCDTWERIGQDLSSETDLQPTLSSIKELLPCLP